MHVNITRTRPGIRATIRNYYSDSFTAATWLPRYAYMYEQLGPEESTKTISQRLTKPSLPGQSSIPFTTPPILLHRILIPTAHRLVSGWSWLNWLSYRTISAATSLHAITIDAGGSAGGKAALSGLFSTVIVDVFDIKGVDMAWYVSEDGEAYVDAKIGAAPGNGPDTDRWEEESYEDDEYSRGGAHFVWIKRSVELVEAGEAEEDV